MATLHIRIVPNDWYAQLKPLAAQASRSLNAQVLSLLEYALLAS